MLNAAEVGRSLRGVFGFPEGMSYRVEGDAIIFSTDIFEIVVNPTDPNLLIKPSSVGNDALAQAQVLGLVDAIKTLFVHLPDIRPSDQIGDDDDDRIYPDLLEEVAFLNELSEIGLIDIEIKKGDNISSYVSKNSR